MKKVFLVHGFKGRPNGGWRPWLMAELEKLDVYACALPMPNPDAPQSTEWIKEIKRNVAQVSEDIYLVGHSLGVPAIFNYLESTSQTNKFGGVFLVSGPCEALEVDKPGAEIRKIDNFFQQPFDFKKIKEKTKKIVVIHGDNDERVPFTHAEKIANSLDCELIAIKNGGHLNGASGWNALPQLLEKLVEVI